MIYPRLLILLKLKSFEISERVFGLTLSFISKRRLRMVLDGKSSRENQVDAGVFEGSILGLTHSQLYINDLPDDAIYANDATLYSKCNQTMIYGSN